MSTPSNTITVRVAPLIKEESVSPVLPTRSLSPETEQWYQTVQEHGLFNGALTAAELNGANALLGLANGKPGAVPIEINIADNFIKVDGQVYAMDPYRDSVPSLAPYEDSDSESALSAYPTTPSDTTASSPCSPRSIGELDTFDGRFRFGSEEQPAPTPEQLRSPGRQAALMAYDTFANPTPHILFYTAEEEAAIVRSFRERDEFDSEGCDMRHHPVCCPWHYFGRKARDAEVDNLNWQEMRNDPAQAGWAATADGGYPSPPASQSEAMDTDAATTGSEETCAPSPRAVKKPRYDVKCWHCKRWGHSRVECPLKHLPRRARAPTPTRMARRTGPLAIEVTEEVGKYLVALTGANTEPISGPHTRRLRDTVRVYEGHIGCANAEESRSAELMKQLNKDTRAWEHEWNTLVAHRGAASTLRTELETIKRAWVTCPTEL
jgi:hypothetical protein